jgi:hypothetical protein
MMMVLKEIRANLISAGVVCGEVGETPCDENFRVGFDIFFSGKPDAPVNDVDMGIEFEISFSEGDGEPGGVAFGTIIVRWGGRIVGTCTPNNYTSDLWVSRKDPQAIEARFSGFELAEFATETAQFILENKE